MVVSEIFEFSHHITHHIQRKFPHSSYIITSSQVSFLVTPSRQTTSIQAFASHTAIFQLSLSVS
ncbi:MAG: hypothetical protein ACOZBL_01465 [Patescibacteria group bacterium]